MTWGWQDLAALALVAAALAYLARQAWRVVSPRAGGCGTCPVARGARPGPRGSRGTGAGGIVWIEARNPSDPRP